MTIFLLVLALIVVLGFLYALVLRPWLKKQPWSQRFFAWIEPVEIALFKKSETVLFGRLTWLAGLAVTAYDGLAAFVGSLNLTPLTTRLFDYLGVPADMRDLSMSAFIALVGFAIVKLRKTSTKPLELVAVPEAQISPAAAIAIAQADVAKEQAVQIVKNTQAG